MQTTLTKLFALILASGLVPFPAFAQSPQPEKAPPAVTITHKQPVQLRVKRTPVQQPAPNPADLPLDIISWDGVDKAVSVKFGEPTARFSFALTNVSSKPVTISAVQTSCGCTTAHLPPMPWKLEPGSNGVINVEMNLPGKYGTVIKTVTVASDKGTKHLLVRTIILPVESSAVMTPASRDLNMKLAQVDRQAVFKGDCASCHSVPARDKMGKALYAAACGVCHEAEHRATMVPDLRVAKQERNEEYWRAWITNGKQGSLMPAFAIPAGGILSEAQINSLVNFLVETMPARPAPVATPTAIR